MMKLLDPVLTLADARAPPDRALHVSRSRSLAFVIKNQGHRELPRPLCVFFVACRLSGLAELRPVYL